MPRNLKMYSRQHWLKKAVGVICFLGSQACMDSSGPKAPELPVTDLLQAMIASPNALTMAIGDSASLTVTARTVSGDTLPTPEPGSIVFTSADVSKVTVDSLGVVHAVANTNSQYVQVKAAWTHLGVTRDTVVAVAVTDTRHPVTDLRIIALDSTRIGAVTSLSSFEQLSFVTIAALTTSGDTVPGVYAPLILPPGAYALSLGFLSRDSTFTSGLLNTTTLGPFWVKAAATIYGVPLRDSVQYLGLYPAGTTIKIDADEFGGNLVSANAGHEDLVQPCADITFTNNASTPVDVVFSDSTLAGGCTPSDQTGNILNLGQNQSAIRKFRPLGSVTWTIRRADNGALLTALTGTITTKEP